MERVGEGWRGLDRGRWRTLHGTRELALLSWFGGCFIFFAGANIVFRSFFFFLSFFFFSSFSVFVFALGTGLKGSYEAAVRNVSSFCPILFTLLTTLLFSKYRLLLVR